MVADCITLVLSINSKLNSNMPNYSDDDQYNQQLHDKSTELWTGAANKRQKAIQNLTPNYQRSKRASNTINQSVSGLMDKQLDSIKQKLNTQKSASKQKDLQIQSLKDKINQLKKDKKMLLGQIEMKHSQEIPEKTINLEKTHNLEHHYKPARKNINSKSQIAESVQELNLQKLEDLPKSKIIQLLRNTSEYQSFAQYHNSYRLVFLKEFYEASKKNLKQQNKGNSEWSERQIIQEMSRLNEKQNLGLNYHNQNILLKRMKEYYDQKFEQKAKKMKMQYQSKTKKVEVSSFIPQDLNQIRKKKQGELAQQMRSKMKSLKK